MSQVMRSTVSLPYHGVGSGARADYHDHHPWSRPNNSVLLNYHPDTRVRCCSTGAIALIQSAINANHAEIQRISREWIETPRFVVYRKDD